MYKIYEMNEIYLIYEIYEMYEMYKMYEEVRDRWKVSKSVRFLQWSQKTAVSRRSDFLVQRAPGSLHWQFNPTEN